MDTALIVTTAVTVTMVAAALVLGYLQNKHLKMPEIENVIAPLKQSPPTQGGDGLVTKPPAELPGVDDLDKLDYYHPGERLIYKFFTGKKVMRFDPVVIEKRMKKILPDLKHHMTLANSQHSDAEMGQELLLEKIRDIFEVKPLERDEDGDGLTNLETMWLFDHYLIYNGTVKKNWRQSATSPGAPSPSSSPSSGEGPPTSNGTGSGS